MWKRSAWVASVVLLLHGIAAAGDAQLDPDRLRAEAASTDDALPDDATDDCGLTIGSGRESLPAGEACLADLERRSVESHAEAADGIGTALRFGSVHGITIRSHGGRETEHDLADCTLVAALARWATALRAEGVTGLDHLSIYRHAARVHGTGRPSGHATGLAIDVSHFRFEDGTVFSVEDDWANAAAGAAPCESLEGESEAQRSVRRLVCWASTSGLFQVVLTPHHDAAHRNHVHLEVRPDVTWRVLE